MTGVTVTVTVTRTLLSLSTLDISASPFRCGGETQSLLFGAVTFAKDVARSPYMDGGILLGAKKDPAEGGLIDVDVTGATQGDIATNLGVLVAAFTQFTYTLSATLDGTAYSWTCWPADYSADVVHPSNVYGFLLPVRLSFTRLPVPAAGPY